MNIDEVRCAFVEAVTAVTNAQYVLAAYSSQKNTGDLSASHQAVGRAHTDIQKAFWELKDPPQEA